MRVVRVIMLLGLVPIALSLSGCSEAACGADGTGCALLQDGGAGDGDGGGGQGKDGAPKVPCVGDAETLVIRDDYRCGSCATDGFNPLVCVDGYLACPKSYVGDTGQVIEVPADMYVVDMADWQQVTGQCAFVAGQGR